MSERQMVITARHIAEFGDTSAGECIGCGEDFAEDERVTMVFVGPGSDPEARRKCREGRSYTGVARLAHLACVTGEEQ